MKRSLKGLLVVLAVFMMLGAAQGASAAEVEGVITEIGTMPNTILVDGVLVQDNGDAVTGTFEICGIRYDYLVKKYNIDLEEQDYVIVEVLVSECLDGTIKLRASSITVGDVTVTLR